jgi:hypothetical protein
MPTCAEQRLRQLKGLPTKKKRGANKQAGVGR